jgi:hypothetical protein
MYEVFPLQTAAFETAVVRTHEHVAILVVRKVVEAIRVIPAFLSIPIMFHRYVYIHIFRSFCSGNLFSRKISRISNGTLDPPARCFPYLIAH